MRQIIRKTITLTLILSAITSLLTVGMVFADTEDTSVTYSTPLLPNITDYSVDTGNDVTLDVNVAEINALEITLSTSNLVIDLTPRVNATSFGDDTLNILVGTSNSTGYTLTMSSIYNGNSTTSLTRTEAINNANPTIDTISAAVSPTTFASSSDVATTNRWGYLLSTTTLDVDKTVYNPVLTTNTINSSTEAVANHPTSLTFGAKVDNTLPAGNYRATLKFMAVTNVNWQYMQDFSSSDALDMATGDVITLIDSRDGTPYLVAKLPDGHVWMIQNLRLGQKGDIYNLNSTNSDTNSFTISNSDRLSTPSFTNASSNGKNGATDYVQYYCTDTTDTSTDYGCYYNWYTATAGSGNSSTGRNTYVEDSICPAGWNLPPSSKWEALYGYYGTPVSMLANDDDRVKNSKGTSPGITTSGQVTTTLSSAGRQGSLWTNGTLSYSDIRAILFVVNETNIYFGNNDPFWFGFPMRCIFGD